MTEEYICSTYSRFPLKIVSGRGSLLKDERGREYIDFGAGIAVNSFGAADPVWLKAVKGQLDRIQHTSNLYSTEPDEELASLICEKTGMKKVFFGNSGAEANECMIKACRKYSSDKYGEGRHDIIVLKNSFHGRTITTLSATAQDMFHKDFGPFTEGFPVIEPGGIDALKALIDGGAAAGLMMEMIQGEGGVMPLEHSFVDEAVRLCRENDVLLLVDEVQTGNGRTGRLYAYMDYGFTPDIFTTAKGLGGGLPIGACVFSERTAGVLTPGSHGSTFGGNPVVCAGAVSVMQRLDDEFIANVAKKGKILAKSLSECDKVKKIYGSGLMMGLEIEGNAAATAGRCLENGLLVLTAKDRVRLLPPLNIPDELLAKGAEILKSSIV